MDGLRKAVVDQRMPENLQLPAATSLNWLGQRLLTGDWQGNTVSGHARRAEPKQAGDHRPPHTSRAWNKI